MDQPLRDPWRAMLRYVLAGVGVAAALVLLSLVLGARPAAAEGTQQRSLVGGLVQGVTGTVGSTVDQVVAPVRPAVPAPAPAAPAPAPAAPAPAAPAPAAPAAPAPVRAPAPAAPAPAPVRAPAPAAPAPVSAPAPAAPAPTAHAPAAATPPSSVPAPAVAPAAGAPAAPARPVADLLGGLTGSVATAPTTAADADGTGTASRPLTDTVVGVLTPVTGTVQAITDARPTAAVVEAIDGLLGVLPVTGDLLGDDTLGTVTRPVTGVADDVLGGVGGTVGALPGTVGTVVSPVEGALPVGPLPVPTLPTSPVLPGGTTPVTGTAPAPVGGGTAPSGTRPSVGAAQDLGPADSVVDAVTATPLSAGTASDAVTPVRDRQDRAPAAGSSATEQPVSATLGGHALLVPAEGDRDGALPTGTGSTGTTGGSASGSAGSAPAGVDGTAGAQFSLAAGSRGTLTDDAVPASVVGDHDVAPD